MRQKRFSTVAMLCAVLITVALTVAVGVAALYVALGREGLAMVETVVLVNTRFVGDYQMESVTDTTLNALISGLGDRWSYYMGSQSYAAHKERKSNSYVGVGITVSYPETGGLLVDAVVKDGPADVAGLRAGDLIAAVAGVNLLGEEQRRGPELIKGAAGSAVLLTVHGMDGETREVSVIRGVVNDPPVSYELLEDGTGLVTIRNFNRRCAEDGIAAVDALVEAGAARLVFDVRNNGGGYLDELTELLDHLLPEGVIFRTEGRMGVHSSVKSDAACVDLPIATLVNEDTYSAAEFFAAQIQEMGRGIIVGTPTFGKGFSQQTFALPTGGAINISTGKYTTGAGVSLIGTSVTLDIALELTQEQAAALLRGELPHAEDPQLQAAVALLMAG